MVTNVVKSIAFKQHRKVPTTCCNRSSSFHESDLDSGSSSACLTFAPHVSYSKFSGELTSFDGA